LWDDSELYWILTRGLKMAGMPAFGVKLNEADRWALVAFMRHLPLLTPAEYQRMSTAAELTLAGEPIPSSQWDAAHDYGFSLLRNQADATRGRDAFREYGCWTCHDSPRTRTGGMVGPDVTHFAERQYIAGVLPNLPGNLAAWIMHPPEFKPGTAMPELNVPEAAAMDIVAYLYAEGDQRRLVSAERVIRDGQQQPQANATRMD
jgi:cytochrome c2